MTAQPVLRLNDGVAVPQLGLGVWQTPAEETAALVAGALGAGYRSIDTAMAYRNEAGVGEGVRRSEVPRDEVFVTTKLWNEDQGYDQTLRAFDASLGRLGLDQLDLYLIHWPAPGQDRYAESWRAMVRLREEGRVRSIGVSNFTGAHLRRIIGETGVTPSVNQVELHPRFQQRELRAVHGELGVVTESWSPLGRGADLGDPAVLAVAKKHGRTAAQAVIRWHLEAGLMVIPKSANPDRIRENLQVFDFNLDVEDMAAFAALDEPGGRMGPDPDAFG